MQNELNKVYIYNIACHFQTTGCSLLAFAVPIDGDVAGLSGGAAFAMSRTMQTACQAKVTQGYFALGR